MDKEHVVRLVAQGAAEEISREARGSLEKVMHAEGATLTDDQLTAVDLGIHFGIQATVEWLLRHDVIKDPM